MSLVQVRQAASCQLDPHLPHRLRGIHLRENLKALDGENDSDGYGGHSMVQEAPEPH